MPLLIAGGIGVLAGVWIGRKTCSVVPVDGGPMRLAIAGGALAAAAYVGYRINQE